MFRALSQMFRHPLAGPLGFTVALILFGLLVATATNAARTEARLRTRITELTAQAAQSNALMRAKLAACESARPTTVAATAPGTVQERAARLAGREPQGFDVCARMESADRAVLESLK